MLLGQGCSRREPDRPRCARARSGGEGRRRDGRPRRRRDDRRARRAARHELAPCRRGRRADARARLRRPARPPADARPGGRGDHRERDAGGCCRRLLRDPRDAEHRPGRRLGGGARLAGRDGPGRGRDPGRLLRRDQQGPGGRRADRDGRARRRRRGRVQRRRPAGRHARAHAARAPVRRGREPAAGASLRGADAVAERPDARGRRLRRAGVRRLPVGRREPDGRARPLARRLRGQARCTSSTCRPGSPSRPFARRGPQASRRPPRSRPTTSA